MLQGKRTYERFVFNNLSQGREESFDQFFGDLMQWRLILSRSKGAALINAWTARQAT